MPGPGPSAWVANTTYYANQMVSASGYYFICLSGGISGSSAPTWPTLFGQQVSDNGIIWSCNGRARAAWASVAPYTNGTPITTSGSISAYSASVVNVPNAQFIGLYSQPVAASVSLGTYVTNVNAAASVVQLSQNPSGTGSVAAIDWSFISQPTQDQIATSGSILLQCVVSGVSGSVQPTWPTKTQLVSAPASVGGTLVNQVNDNGVLWQQVGYTSTTGTTWTANTAYSSASSFVIAGNMTWDCIVSGTSGSVAPAWTSIRDGSVVWQVVGSSP